MKRILVFATMLLLALNIVAQSPNKISYQAVVRNSGNNIVTNQQIGVRISILKASTNGVPVYIETQSTTTNQNGLMSIIIGNGNSSYNFSAIDWANGPYFVKTETDPEGGTNYMITGISQILSVPYALHAQTAESITGTITETDPVFGASAANGITSTNISNWNSAYTWGNHASAGYLKTYTETDPVVKSKIGIIKSNGSTISTAVAGTDYLLPSGSAAQLTNFPTLNQNTTGTASNVTGTIALTNGGTGATTATTARLNLGATTVGNNIFTLANPSDNSFIQINANNTVSTLSASAFRTAISAGTVTSVSGTAPIVSSGGNTPALSITAATQSAAGSMSAADKTKLDGIASGATNYAHPTTDGNLHVLPTGTSNNGKVLTAGATAGSLSWTTPTTGTVTSVSGTAPIVSSGGNTPALSITAATQSAAGSMSAADKTKLDGIAAGAEVNVNADWNATSGDEQILNIPANIDVDKTDDVTLTGNQTIAGNKTLTGALAVTTTASIGTSTPALSAALEVSSTSQGFLPPRLNSFQKKAIVSPVAGLMIWCSNCGSNGEIQVFNGSVWTNMIGGTASIAMPIFNATTTTEITKYSTKCSTQIADDGGSTVTARGVCWSTITNPTTADSKTTDGTGIGTFTSSITGLNSNTLYYVKAYAITSLGTSYGTQLSFTTSPDEPVLSTKTAAYVFSTSAQLGGTITSDGGSAITAFGVCWSTTPNPTISNNKTVDGTGKQSFTSTIIGLRGSSLYYVRAYATNGAGTSYGNQQTITTKAPTLPGIYTNAVSSTDYISAICGVDVYTDCGGDITARGVCWSTTQNPTIENNKTSDGTGIGVFSSTITGLTLFSTYYIRAYATNIAGTAYGAQKVFIALAPGYSYQGGKVAYVLQSGDPGYILGEVHGFIITESDQSSNASWGCSGTSISTGQGLGTGKANTIAIEAACTTTGTAADICANLVLNGYDDWFLPSTGEWSKIWLNNAILDLRDRYWSSTQENETMANFGFTSFTHLTSGGSKGGTSKVRAIRSF